MSAVGIRPARVDDAAGILAVQAEAAREGVHIATQPEEVRSVAEEAKRLAELAPGTGVVLVAEMDGQIVGICGARRPERRALAHTADLGITVAASHRGRGVGRALLHAAEAWAREAGVRKITLGVFTTNEPARRLYRSMGYEEEGLRRGQYLLPSGFADEVLMAKWVDR